MSQNTFTLRRKDGSSELVDYTPLLIIAGSVPRKLALHKDSLGHWVVSDPVSGGCVVRHVTGQYRGVTVSSRGVTLREVRQLALTDVEGLIARVGAEKFNSVLDAQQLF